MLSIIYLTNAYTISITNSKIIVTKKYMELFKRVMIALYKASKYQRTDDKYR
jgi:hypothetical protein